MAGRRIRLTSRVATVGPAPSPRAAARMAGNSRSRGVLEQVAGGPGLLDRPQDVGVGVEGGEDQHPGRGEAGGDLGRGRGPVHLRHLEVHEDHVGSFPLGQGRLGPGGGLLHHLEVGLAGNAQPVPDLEVDRRRSGPDIGAHRGDVMARRVATDGC